jgi:ribosomal protein S18 acetylase RimI-like enzyme
MIIDIAIRNGTPDDYMAIKNIYHKSLLHNYQTFLTQNEMDQYLDELDDWDPSIELSIKNNFLIIAESPDEVVGYLIFAHKDNNVTYIDQIRVHPNYQGYGIGSTLMIELHQRSVGRCIILTVNSKNKKAFQFYLNRNYHPVKFYGKNRVLMHYGPECNTDHSNDKDLNKML